jgi:protein FAM32A
MPSSDYTSTPSTGKLKLKGVKDSKVKKKKKNKQPQKEDNPVEDDRDNSVMLKKLEDEDREIGRDKERGGEERKSRDGENEEDGVEVLGMRVKTEAERRHDEQRRKRVRLHQLSNLAARILCDQRGLCHPVSCDT